MIRETRRQTPMNQPHERRPIWRRLLEGESQLGRDWHPVRSSGPELEAAAEPATLGQAETVEDGGFRIHELGAPLPSRFEFFLDGIEHTRICGYVGTVPVVHGYVAAVIRRRAERAFSTWEVMEEEVLAFPHILLDPARFIELDVPARALIDSGGEAGPAHPIQLAESGRTAVKLHRATLERRLARNWAGSGPRDSWLLVDGGLAIEPALLKSGRAIGLVKSHRTQFLDPEAMAAVLEMGAARRSTLFKPLRPEVGEVYSWYLRLRAPVGHDIYWGLARIEGRASDDTLEGADLVSRWLLAETAPLSLPDTRWHVLLYPIRDCETFLRARMPTLEIG
jgi:hypothetical protein